MNNTIKTIARQSLFLLLGIASFAHAEADSNIQDLSSVYQMAVQNDPDLAAAIHANQAAQELVTQAKAGYRPNVNFVAGANKNKTDLEIVGSASPFRGGTNDFEDYNYGVQASQPVYRKQNLVQIGQSKLQVKQSDKQLALSKQDLMLKTTEAYFDVLIAQDTVTLIEAQKAAILKQLEQAKVTFNVGTSTITDVNEAQARYDLIVAQEISAKNSVTIARHGLEVLIGRMPTRLATVEPSLKTAQLKQEMAVWQADTLKHNLNVLIQQDTVALAQKSVDFAKAGHLPTLDAVASFTKNRSNGGVNGFGNQTENGQIGLRLELPIYAGGGISSKVNQSARQQQEAKDRLEAVKRKANLETQRTYLNLKTSIAQVSALEQALNSSQSQLDSTKLGYEVGVRTSVDVLDAQQQYYSANRDLLEARYNYLVNIIRLKYATGILSEPDIADINLQLVSAKDNSATK